MSCQTLTGPIVVVVNCNSGAQRIRWMTGWYLAMGVDAIRCVLKNLTETGEFQSQVVIQTAAVRPDSPDSPATFGSALVGAGEAVVDGSIATTTDDVYWVRFGIAYQNETGTGFSQAEVSLEVSFTSCGKAIGGASLSLETDTTGNKFVAITSMIPAKWAAKLKAALVCSSFTGALQMRLCYRTAATSKEVPGNWTTTFDTARSASACTGELAITTSDMWIQFGVQYFLSSGSTLATGNVDAQLSIRP